MFEIYVFEAGDQILNWTELKWTGDLVYGSPAL
jgi:hypothetical protein